MQVKEALDLLGQVCSGYRGTLQEHQLLQEALHLVKNECILAGKIVDTSFVKEPSEPEPEEK